MPLPELGIFSMKWAPVFELIGFFGVISAIPFIAWTKMTLGAVLTLTGAYFSHLRPSRKAGGELEIDTGQTRFRYSGGLSLFVWGSVSVAGLILIFSAGVDSKVPIEVAIEKESARQVRTDAKKLGIPGVEVEASRTKEKTGVIIAPYKADDDKAAMKKVPGALTVEPAAAGGGR